MFVDLISLVQVITLNIYIGQSATVSHIEFDEYDASLISMQLFCAFKITLGSLSKFQQLLLVNFLKIPDLA